MLSYKRFIGYGMTGGTAAIVDFGLFLVFEGVFGIAVPLAATGSFLIAALVNFAISSLLVFKTPLTPRRFMRFLSVASIGFTINVGVTWLLYELRGDPVLAKAIGIGTAFVFNYVAHSFLVFGRPENKPG